MTSTYAKAIIAAIGAAVTAALGLIPPNTTVWQILTVISAFATTLAVYHVPNADPVPPAKAAAAKPAVQAPRKR